MEVKDAAGAVFGEVDPQGRCGDVRPGGDLARAGAEEVIEPQQAVDDAAAVFAIDADLARVAGVIRQDCGGHGLPDLGVLVAGVAAGPLLKRHDDLGLNGRSGRNENEQSRPAGAHGAWLPSP